MKKSLKEYQDKVLTTAKKTMKSNDVDYVAEDLRSPCTQKLLSSSFLS